MMKINKNIEIARLRLHYISMTMRKKNLPASLLLWIAVTLPFCSIAQPANSQITTDPWTIQADTIDPSNYYGVTVANGMIGLVSSPEPFKVKDVVLNGAFDLYG